MVVGGHLHPPLVEGFRPRQQFVLGEVREEVVDEFERVEVVLLCDRLVNRLYREFLQIGFQTLPFQRMIGWWLGVGRLRLWS